MQNHRLAIFASGSGSNAEQIIKHFRDHSQIKIVAVFTNKTKAGVIKRAQTLNIPVVVFDRNQLYDNGKVLLELQQRKIDIIILAGFLWLVPPNILQAYPQKMLNIHPALLPKFGGAGMYGMHVHRAVLSAGEKESGITIHEVNEEYDKGRIVFRARCKIAAHETPETLVKKIHDLEHRHYPQVIERWLTSK